MIGWFEIKKTYHFYVRYLSHGASNQKDEIKKL